MKLFKKNIRRVFIIVRRPSDMSYLLLISSKKHLPIGLVGGRVDDTDNKPIVTAIRELYEETALEIADLSRFKYLGPVSNKLFYLLDTT